MGSVDEISLSKDFLELTDGGGEVGKLIRAIDWRKHRLGPYENWPQSLKTSLSVCLGSKFPMFLWWGPELVVFYNDAYIPFTGLKHPHFFGRLASEQWAEIWDDLKPLTDNVLKTGRATWNENMQLYMTRKGFLEETYFTFSYSPIRDESGQVNGIINPCQETTGIILAERRHKTLYDLATKDPQSIEQVATCAVNALEKNALDVPFAMFYETHSQTGEHHLIASLGVTPGSPLAPLHVGREQTDWLFEHFCRIQKPERLDGLRVQFSNDLSPHPHEEKPDSVYIHPLEIPGHAMPVGFFVFGVSSRLEFDEPYQGFLDLIAKQTSAHMANVNSVLEEKKRLQALADLDKAKTIFFSNVSHEFRTPLTLLLGPAEEALNDKNTVLSNRNRERVEVIYRNALRLQKLVNSLLDFSRVEAGRVQAHFRRIDMAKFTRAIASAFETVMQKAGVEFSIVCEDFSSEVFVDPDLWEKILLNLISNAFKFTLQGKISVHLYAVAGELVLDVEDTGSGISEKDLPHIFERFYRVEGAQSRTYEGSGIGLALVQELVGMHGGKVSVVSRHGQGTTFTVKIPFGSAHLPVDRVELESTPETQSPSQLRSFIEETSHWEDKTTLPTTHTHQLPLEVSGARHYRIVLAEDNLDMRRYVHQLLTDSGNGWEVFPVSNGVEALQLVKETRPDLVITDVMMPMMDGFGLLRAIREDENLRITPVILLSARAGEVAKLEGIERAADDYLIKPFSGKELIARVTTQLQMSSMRVEAIQQARANLAKSQFLANMSHEIRTPLGAILGFAELMLEPNISAEERETYLNTIIRNGRHLTGLINEVLDLSKIESDRLEIENIQFSISELIDEITTLLGLRADEKGLSLRVVYEGMIPKQVNSDPSRIKQIILNIVGNAIKFTSHGHVELKVRYLAPEDKIEISVTDTGIGISADQQKMLFKRFVQADNSMTRKYGGTGLGLVVSQNLARLLGGSLVLKHSEVGTGSTFVLTVSNNLLPADQRSPSAVEPSRALAMNEKRPDKELPLDALKILVTEDSLENQFLITYFLKSAGAQVTCANDGEEGVQKALAAEYDLLLMDLQMPKKNGFEATAELRQLSFSKPIIAITAHTMKGDRERCLANGFDEHLGKPIDKKLLIAKIKQVLHV